MIPRLNASKTGEVNILLPGTGRVMTNPIKKTTTPSSEFKG